MLRRVLLSTGVVVAVALPAAVALADGSQDPIATGVTATTITTTSAALRATLDPAGKPTTYRFQYGTTTSYGTWTPTGDAGKGKTPVAVSTPIGGLQPSTTYHFRLSVTNGSQQGYGYDHVVTTSAADAPSTTPTLTPTPTPTPTATPGGTATPAPTATPEATPAAELPPPALGKAVAVGPASGTVLVRAKGEPGFVPLQSGASLPVGSVVDATHGTVVLTSALDRAGHAQTGEFRGSAFVVRQDPGDRGLTQLVLTGPKLDCPPARKLAAAARKKGPKRRTLWGSDHGGRFSTRGANSVATVRGTRWMTQERCGGTVTRVTQGAVAVRDLRRHRTVVVTAGHAYLARAARH